MKKYRCLIMVVISLFFIVSIISVVWSGTVTRPPRSATEQEAQKDIYDTTHKAKTPPGLDLKIWMEPYLVLGAGGKTDHVKNIGTAGAGNSTFTARFQAKCEGSNICFTRSFTSVVPSPGHEVTRNYMGIDITNFLHQQPIGWLARIIMSPPEKNSNNNEHSINLTYDQCKLK